MEMLCKHYFFPPERQKALLLLDRTGSDPNFSSAAHYLGQPYYTLSTMTLFPCVPEMNKSSNYLIELLNIKLDNACLTAVI